MNKVALITGSTSGNEFKQNQLNIFNKIYIGIGLGIAKVLASKGYSIGLNGFGV